MTTTIRDFNTLTPEERRRIGQIYGLILSWQHKKKQKPKPTAVEPSDQTQYAPTSARAAGESECEA
jgi:hypothetical protein